MNESTRSNLLNDSEILLIKKQARDKLNECSKLNDVIGSQIFSILGLYSRVLHYPIDADGPWGFTCISTSSKPFVLINSSISMDKQIFAAAHELYHIWFESSGVDYIPPSVLGDVDETGIALSNLELRANRFAAEFLVEEKLLEQEMYTYSVKANGINEKDVLWLASHFMVPYEMMVKRLFEISAIKNKDRESFLNVKPETITQLRRRYSITMPEADNRISLENLVELAANAYESRKITYEKLTYLLSLTKMRPEDIGISDKIEYVPPTDADLDSIMEE